LIELKCQYCGVNTDLPFKCPFCGGYFCIKHRLPEFHACQSIKRKTLQYETLPKRREEAIRLPIHRKITPKFFRFLYCISSRTEITHLFLGASAVMLVGFSAAISETLAAPFLELYLLIFALTFILHELAHKFTAKYYGLWAEFRLSLIGLMVTLISAISPLIKIISPGTVFVSGEASRAALGKVSLSGPIINMLLSIIFLIINMSSSTSPFKTIFAWGSIINAYVALFNLIPFSILDGVRIFWWNKYIWTVTFLFTLILVVIDLAFFW
jgi:Zn-dependent protease